MNTEKQTHTFPEGVIYTLAQRETDLKKYNGLKVVLGNGTDGKNEKAMKGRAKRKMVTQKLALSLIDVAKERGDTKIENSLWNAHDCQTNITSANGRVYGDYCKTRFCTLCLSIRQAKILNRYLPVIKDWEDPRFITLTAKAVKIDKLEWWINCIQKAFSTTHKRINKRHLRGKGIKVLGVKSLECNFNPKDKTYNPHFHLIVPNCEIGKLLMVEWQITMNSNKEWKRILKTKKKIADGMGQHTRRIKKNIEEDLIETVKYGSKVFTDFDNKKKSKDGTLPKVYVVAIYNVYSAMKRKRLFDRFGFNLPKEEKFISKGEQIINSFEDWTYQEGVNDWVNSNTGELLTGYVPTPQLYHLLENHLDISLE